MAPRGYHVARGLRPWGRVQTGDQLVARPRFVDEIATLVHASRAGGLTSLCTGLGRSYGDSALNQGQTVIDMSRLDRVLAFDAVNGVLRAEAGLGLSDVITRIVPHGWFLPTTPGTRFVTLGGAVANDVHGKNHGRAGTFGASVRRIGLWRSDRGEVEISPDLTPELFCATVGGLGLTGAILWVEIQLARIGSSRLDVETIPFGNLDQFLQIALESEAGHEHTVAWVDCSSRGPGFGRGVFTRANWRDDGPLTVHTDRRRLTLPVDLPGFALNGLSLAALNALIHARQTTRPRREICHYAQAFYPLDAIGAWNRLYGPRGFFQFQCVTPLGAGMQPVADLLAAISAVGQGSFLVVLKTFGERASPGLLSFPRRGVTLAIDVANRGERTLALLSRLDRIVMAAGGRLYPAKDGRMPPAMFRAGYPELPRFIGQIDPAFSSSFWRRMCHD